MGKPSHESSGVDSAGRVKEMYPLFEESYYRKYDSDGKRYVFIVYNA